jgi:hypothetical protein
MRKNFKREEMRKKKRKSEKCNVTKEENIGKEERELQMNIKRRRDERER